METEETKNERRGGDARAAARKAAREAGVGEKKRLRRAARAAASGAAALEEAGSSAAARGAKRRGAKAGAAAEGRTRRKAGGARRGAKGLAKLAQPRRKRMFDGGELRLVLLKLIADEPRHGYELIKSIEELAAGSYAPSPGVIYPTLTMLTETGHVVSDDDGEGRRRFSITGAGSAELVESEERIGKLFNRLSTAGEKHQRTDAMPVRRAMSSLRSALQDRLGQGEVSDDTLLQVVALIEETAQKIERLGE